MMEPVYMNAISKDKEDVLNKIFQVKTVKLISELRVLVDLSNYASHSFDSYFAFFW